MVVKLNNRVRVLWGILLLVGGVSLRAKTGLPGGAATATPDKVLRYVRERFGIPETTKMTADPFRDSAFPDYYETLVTVDDGKQKKSQTIFVSKDGHYLVLGNLYALGGDPKAEIAQHVRELFKVPATMGLVVGAPEKSNFADFYQITVTATDGKQKQTPSFFVTKDNRTLVLGSVFVLAEDPRREVLRTISTDNQPGVGPPHAPVTVVEYADLQCPSCAGMHAFLEKELLPKYGDKVRVIFKEFPLVNFHDWAYTAAIANECAYQIEPTTFLPYRSLIFQHQSNINATNVRDLLLDYGEQAGVDRLKLAACIDSKASVSRVDRGRQEGQALNVSSTPTFFINGKILVGAATPAAFYKAVDEAMLEAREEQKVLGSRRRAAHAAPRTEGSKQ